MPEKGHSRTDIGTVKQQWSEHGLRVICSSSLKGPLSGQPPLHVLSYRADPCVLVKAPSPEVVAGQDQHGVGKTPLHGKSMGT